MLSFPSRILASFDSSTLVLFDSELAHSRLLWFELSTQGDEYVFGCWGYLFASNDSFSRFPESPAILPICSQVNYCSSDSFVLIVVLNLNSLLFLVSSLHSTSLFVDDCVDLDLESRSVDKRVAVECCLAEPKQFFVSQILVVQMLYVVFADFLIWA